MSGQKARFNSMDRNKKKRAVTQMWRPVSTEANSIEEGCTKDVTAELDNKFQINEVHSSASSSISNAQQHIKAVEALTEVTDSTVISSSVGYGIEARVQEGSLLSVEKHTLTVEIGASLIQYIEGRGGSTQKKIEEEMGVKILFQSSNDSISIEGNSIASVTRAQEKMHEIIDEVVNSPNLDYSHFISLPLALNPELVDKLINFQNSILGNSNSSLDSSKELGIDQSIFIEPKTFHLTVLMLKLWNKGRVLAASEVLKSLSSKVRDGLDNRPVHIRLKGLDTMKGSMAKARVLYATVEEIGNEERLLRACQVITDAFVEAGLVLEKDAKHKLKLHATVMNVRHREGKQRRNWTDSFDARGIFRQFGSEDWGVYLLREAHLSQRHVFDENGYYHCCASLPFPEEIQTDGFTI